MLFQEVDLVEVATFGITYDAINLGGILENIIFGYGDTIYNYFTQQSDAISTQNFFTLLKHEVCKSELLALNRSESSLKHRH